MNGNESVPLLRGRDEAANPRPSAGEENQTSKSIKFCDGMYSIFFNLFFYIPCFLTGQLPMSSPKTTDKTAVKFYKYVVAILTLILLVGISLSVNLLSSGFNFYIIIWCPYKNCGYISTIFNKTEILNITNAFNVSNSSGLKGVQPTSLIYFDDWKKTVFTTATLSGTISFLFMVHVLYSQYSVCRDTFCKCCKWCSKEMWECCGEKIVEKSEGLLLSPFKDDENINRVATKLTPKQATYFMTIFIFNLLIYGTNVGLLFSIFAESVNKNLKNRETVDGFGLASQFASQFCAILSCFIFSKLAYSVWNTCVHKLPDLYKEIDDVDVANIHPLEVEENYIYVPQENEFVVNVHMQRENDDRQNTTVTIPYIVNDDHLKSLKDKEYIDDKDMFICMKHGTDHNGVRKMLRLHLLKAIANWYSRMLHTTLHPFGTWFVVHWVLFTVAAFMLISYLAETIILELYGQERADKECHGERTMHCRLRFCYVFFFAVEHCILFLYPCFRAASVTSAYTSMIKKVSKAEWNNISLDDKEKFINYLKIQDCTFKISILCAKLSFGFYIAYFSIFVGIFGVVLKLAL